jgi:hypothetical protein
MAIEIKWSLESVKTYDRNIQYLLREWSEKEIDKFLKQTDYVLSRLQDHPESFNPSMKNKKVRRARLNKYITLYYRYNPSRKQIILLSFWNVKQDPEKLRF